MNYGLKPLNLIFITHDLSIAQHISDNIMVLNFGKVVEFNFSKDNHIHHHEEIDEKSSHDSL